MTILFDGRFPQGADLSGYVQQVSGSLALEADPLGSGETVARMTISEGDAEVAGGIRTELTPIDTDLRVQGNEYWYWMAYLVPEDWTVIADEATAQGFIIHQIHDTPDGGDPGRHGTLTVDIVGDVVRFHRSYEGQNGYDTMARVQLQKGRWHTIALNALWAADSSGHFTIWHDYRKIMDVQAAASNFDDVTGPYYKEGIYKVSAAAAWPPGVTSRTVYHKGVAVGDDSYASLDAFLAALNLADVELEGFVTPGVGL